ncbi:sensor histidine kinase [Jiella marina]|uniref:sensor histidine kinase n=1 Tax=Jiella sp. LLJ827 TaxID=2917712 RepID=UPI002100F571|nr:PAS domain-containing protein [Jiella sp. LLJ827]MCQ0986672.1 PAS domain-containing protein [Jiella sp. LLJ827]
MAELRTTTPTAEPSPVSRLESATDLGLGAGTGTPDFAQVFDLLATPHMILDRELRFVAVNRAYEGATQRRREDLIGRQLFDLFPSSDAAQARLRQSIQYVFDTGEPSSIAFIPYEVEEAKGADPAREIRFWSATHTPVAGKDGRIDFVVQNTIDVTDIVQAKRSRGMAEGAAVGEVALWENARSVEVAHQRALEQSAEFRRLFRQAPGMVAVLEGPELRTGFVNDSFSSLIGERDLVGVPLSTAIPELIGQDILPTLEEVLKTGEPISRQALPLTIRHHSGLRAEHLLDIFCNPIRNAEGQVDGVFFQGVDRTEAMRAGHHQRLLMDELNHRVKNTLATIQSMARQSFRDSDNLEVARHTFESRIMALSRAHNVLAEQRWEAAPLRHFLEALSQDSGSDQLRWSGPDIPLSAKSGVALSIVLHEMHANARRHGALRYPDGIVEISWRLVDPVGGRLSFHWWEYREHAASGVGSDFERAGVLPFEPGFGIRIIQTIVERELAGRLTLDLADESLNSHFEVELPEIGTSSLVNECNQMRRSPA